MDPVNLTWAALFPHTSLRSTVRPSRRRSPLVVVVDVVLVVVVSLPALANKTEIIIPIMLLLSTGVDMIEYLPYNRYYYCRSEIIFLFHINPNIQRSIERSPGGFERRMSPRHRNCFSFWLTVAREALDCIRMETVVLQLNDLSLESAQKWDRKVFLLLLLKLQPPTINEHQQQHLRTCWDKWWWRV